MAREHIPERLTATVRCAECGDRASDVIFLPPTVLDDELRAPPGAPQGVMAIFSDEPRLAIHGGPVSVELGALAQPADVARAVSDGSAAALFALDREYAPFWCPQCGAAYCGDDWDVEDVFDEGFYERQMGTCPRGHRRTLID